MDSDAEVVPTPATGQEWAYRLRDDSSSQRVKIVSIDRQTRKFRVEIRHLDGDLAGKEENVPRSRLKVPWNEVGQYDASMDNWKLLRSESVDENESSAMWTAVELLIPSAVAELFLTPVDDALVIHDLSALESLTNHPLDALPTNHSWITYNGKPCLSPLASLTIAEWACHQNPAPVLERILAEEAEAREKSKRGGTSEDWETREPTEASPEYEYERYLRWTKPIHELLRQWCGYRSVTAHERLLAAEAEVNRLDVLLAWSVDYIRRSNESIAATVESEHETDRITPYNIRPVPQRPLEPHEIPVIEVPSRRRWPR